MKQLILSYILKIGKDPSYHMLKLLNKIIKGESDLSRVTGDGNSGDKPSSIFAFKSKGRQDLESKSVEFETYIRELQMIKFYSEAILDEDKLTLLTIQSSLKLLSSSKIL